MKTVSLVLCLCVLTTYMWGQKVDWKLGVSVPLNEPNLSAFFSNARDAGFEYLEVGLPTFKRGGLEEYMSKVAEYRDKAQNAGLKIWSIHIPFSWNFDISTPDKVKQEQCKQNILYILDLAKGLGSYEKAILHPSFEPIDPLKRKEHLVALRDALHQLAPYIEKNYHVRLAIEDLPRTCLGNSSTEILDIVGDLPSVDVCFDSNHLLGEKSEDFVRKVDNRIKTVHISDYDEINERHWLPGKGVTNWNMVIDQLVKAGYEGPFMFEVTKKPWGDDSKAFCQDLAASWKEIKANYTQFRNSLKNVSNISD